MRQQAQTIDDIRRMADEVAQLMVSRFGGGRSGDRPSLDEMFRRRGAALPRRLRGPARRLAEADRRCAQPRVGRQQDMRAVSRAYHALTSHLRPLGEVSRFQNRALHIGASVALALLLIAAGAIWIMLRRGTL